MEVRSNNEHFAAIADRYLASLNGANRIVYENIRRELDARIRGVVVDIGNGGVFTYDPTLADRIVAVDPVFKDVAPVAENAMTTFVPELASDMPSVADRFADTVIMQFLVHHIVGRDLSETNRDVRRSFDEVARVLGPNGRLLIVEMITHPIIEWIENLAYPVTRFSFRCIGKPMVKFYSRRGLKRHLERSGLECVEVVPIDMGRSFDILGGWAPGIVRMPSCISPLRCTLFEVRSRQAREGAL